MTVTVILIVAGAQRSVPESFEKDWRNLKSEKSFRLY